ncbi:MAG: sigma-54-dependent Fis family transcriptional regulator [Burkholderiales bacterium]|nr:sigma-54-dependent Fis family transcriptional regulator [Burkholderiales bacterium]
MLTNAERMVRARVVLERRRIAVEDLLATEISASWSRCLDAGLDPHGTPQKVVVSEREVRRRRERIGHVHHLALAEIETLYHQIAGSNFLIAFSDADGTVLESVSDSQFGDSDAGRRIIPGSQWSEDVCGTNALGTAMVTGQPIIVHGSEHFFSCYGQVCCTAAPVRGPTGELVGMLDASSDCVSRQRHTLALVKMAATHIENGLFVQQLGSQMILAIHPRAEFLGTINAGMIAIDAAGFVTAVNGRAANMLAGLQVGAGSGFEQVFNEPLERLLARLHTSHQTFVRDALGSALAVAWINHGARVASRAPVEIKSHASAPLTRKRLLREPHFVAEDLAVRETLALVAAAVGVKAPILIQGETGSGKEMLARYAHEVSGRKGHFVAINCAAMPEHLFEAELFGYAAGAFTGARKEGSVGLIASADGGTLLLDEIGALALQLQATLLRFLDDRLVREVGGRGGRVVDLQVLAATNADLAAEVAARRFRPDLLYRLNTIKATLPPLRARSDFAAALRFALKTIDPAATVSAEAATHLAAHDWPGNFRELRAILTRALLSAPDSHIDLEQVDIWLQQVRSPSTQPTGSVLREKVAEAVVREFHRSGGNVSHTARNLAISRNTVYHHLREAAKRESSIPD